MGSSSIASNESPLLAVALDNADRRRTAIVVPAGTSIGPREPVGKIPFLSDERSNGRGLSVTEPRIGACKAGWREHPRWDAIAIARVAKPVAHPSLIEPMLLPVIILGKSQGGCHRRRPSESITYGE